MRDPKSVFASAAEKLSPIEKANLAGMKSWWKAYYNRGLGRLFDYIGENQ